MRTISPDDDRVAPPDAKAECGICGGVATRRGRPTDEFRYRGRNVISETWTCGNCHTSGAVLRDPENGRPLRLPHTLTGEGNVRVQ